MLIGKLFGKRVSFCAYLRRASGKPVNDLLLAEYRNGANAHPFNSLNIDQADDGYWLRSHDIWIYPFKILESRERLPVTIWTSGSFDGLFVTDVVFGMTPRRRKDEQLLEDEEKLNEGVNILTEAFDEELKVTFQTKSW